MGEVITRRQGTPADVHAADCKGGGKPGGSPQGRMQLQSIRHVPTSTDMPRTSPAPGATRPHTVLVFQGGGALGAYQAGVFEALQAQGIAPDWLVGTSIGAINAALIAGNPPPRRLD